MRLNAAPKTSEGNERLLRGSGPGQFEGMSGGGSGSVAFAGDLYGRKGEFDTVLIERLLDHCVNLAAYHGLLAWQCHHFRHDLHCVIAEVVDPLHL